MIMDKCILVIGGAGYIGSHTNKLLTDNDYRTLVYDNLVYGHREFVKWGDFILGDTSDIDQLGLTFKQYNIHAVVYFSAFAYVEESVKNPSKYYTNNVANTINVLNTMVKHDVKYFVFSSSCAVFGEPTYLPIDEAHPKKPVNPYGKTKLIVEEILKDYDKAYGIKHINLRYFNAAGADHNARIGEDHNPETHIIPLLLDTAMGKRDTFTIFGDDYKSKDGTCVRDYIHVEDLADAHLKALAWLMKNNISESFNLGYDTGFSVKELIAAAEDIINVKIPYIMGGKREGDPAALVSSSEKAKEILGWKCEHSSLDNIIISAWEWHKKRFKK